MTASKVRVVPPVTAARSTAATTPRVARPPLPGLRQVPTSQYSRVVITAKTTQAIAMEISDSRPSYSWVIIWTGIRSSAGKMPK